MNPLEQLSAPQQQPAMPQQAPLAALAGQQPMRQPPRPTAAQTVAAVHRFSAIRAAIAPVMSDPKLGKENIRPTLLDAASKLLADRILTLPEVMSTVKDLPDDPTMQRKFVEQIFSQASKARSAVQEHFAASPEAPEGAPEWSPDNHAEMLSGLMEHYKNG